MARDLGTVEQGKLADLAFIAGDPLTRIEDLANVQAVMKNGRIYTVAELELPFLSPGGAQKAAPVQHQLLTPAPGVEKSRATHWWHNPEQMIEDMIEDSYDLVVSRLPRARRFALGWDGDAP